MKVEYGKSKKPLEMNCKRYCDEYPCNKQECYREKMFKGNNNIYMGEKELCDRLNSSMKWKNWHNKGECIFNNDTFTRRKLA